MSTKYVLALDQGTTSSRAILFDNEQNIIAVQQREFEQIYPQQGWVEHNPMEIWSTQYGVMNEVVAQSGVDVHDIAAIGITNQRETTILWEKATGRPIYNAIVWQCRRTAPLVDELLQQPGMADYIRENTGLMPDAYFSATKIKWILDNVPGARERAEAGEILFGTVDTWLVWKLTGGRVHVTDATNASRTMLYDIGRGCWDEQLLHILDIPACILPEVRSSSEVYGYTDLMGARLPICGIAGDQQAALFGQGCFRAGEGKNTYGTGCFLLTNTGRERVTSSNGLLTTVAATCLGDPTEYALEGSVFVAGAVIQWLRDELHLINEADDSQYFAEKLTDSGGVYVVPAFTGLGAPYWDMHTRGAVLGLSRGTGAKHLIRAALESVAYQTNDVIRAMEADMGALRALRVDGGAAANDFLMQFQADISDLPVFRPESMEATARGAASLAGLACGLFTDRDAVQATLRAGTSFTPSMSPDQREALLSGWHRAVEACRVF